MDLVKWCKAYAKVLKDTNQELPSTFTFDQAFYAVMEDQREHVADAYKLVRQEYEGENDG